MALLLAFAVTLVVAVLISGLAEKTILSVAVLFLASGILLGSGLFWQLPQIEPGLLQRMMELALFSVLFTDGMKTGGVHQIRNFWRLPARALLLGMPLTIIGIAVLARYMAGLDWTRSFLVGAALSPTDPVFVAGIFRFEAVPKRVKRLLNVESGLNDGLSLPVVLLLLGYTSAKGPFRGRAIEELALGVAVGLVIPWVELRLERTRFLHASGLYHSLNAFAVGLLVLATCYLTGANLFVAAFTAGIAMATFGPSFTESFRDFGELVSELLKVAALLIFGAVMAPRFFSPLPGLQYGFILLAEFGVRPVAIAISMLRSELVRHETLLTAWFGPKGFASVVYGLLIYHAGFIHVAQLVGLAVAFSIIVYSSTDILIGRWFQRRHERRSEPAADLRGRPAA